LHAYVFAAESKLGEQECNWDAGECSGGIREKKLEKILYGHRGGANESGPTLDLFKH
jgi:hypothetical protein